MADETRAALDTIPAMTVRRDAHGLTIDVAGKRESIVLDYWPENGVRLFVFDEFGNEMQPAYTLTDDDCNRSGELANVPGGPGAPARSIPFVFRADVPAGCPLSDAEIVDAINGAGIGGPAGVRIGRANAIDLDGDLLAAADRFRKAAKYYPDCDDGADAVKLADAFLGIL
ncbi:hypothetical protein SH661x_001814 [Planctomicrobium sp. SH661]|uniref:hypothetical protein n=1 Tax=Planctomicrobium sp. SH661 TaxID=3448124 RepID=UPI003F5CB498